MKIILLHYTAPPIIGGVETALARQARQLVRAGHIVTILAGRGKPWDAHIGVETINLFDLRHPLVLRAKASLDAGQIPEDFAGLVHQVESELRRACAGAQVVIAHNIASQNKHLALTAALHNLSQDETAPQVVLWHHDLLSNLDDEQENLHEGWPWELLHTDWPGVKQVAVSDARRQELAALLGLPLRKVALVPSGIDLSDFLDLPPHVSRLAGDLKLSLAAPILLCPVRLTRRKNLEQALEILAELRKRMPAAVLLITGQSGSQGRAYFEQLKSLRSQLELDNAAVFLAERFPEGLNEKALSGFYRLADAVLITSREEGFGMPLLEAGLTGMPIFCTALEALRALAGENAVYFSPDDPAKQVAALIVGRLQSDPLYRMRVRVRHDFTWDSIYRKQLAPLLAKD
jgi:glycosyltransferase involved in cell wall biosynthesis